MMVVMPIHASTILRSQLCINEFMLLFASLLGGKMLVVVFHCFHLKISRDWVLATLAFIGNSFTKDFTLDICSVKTLCYIIRFCV